MGLAPRIATAIILMVCLWSFCEGVADINVTTVLCNSGLYTAGDPFAISLEYVLNELETVTPTQINYDFQNISPYPNAFAYGHAACNANLTTSDCETCLAAAKTAVFNTCPNRIGARAVLHDCSTRYEQYPFDD